MLLFFFWCTLDFNLARVGLEDCEEVAEDTESRVQLDPSVWAHPVKQNESAANPFGNAFRQPNADPYLRQGIPHPYHLMQMQQQHQLQQQQDQLMQQQQQNLLEKLQQSSSMVRLHFV